MVGKSPHIAVSIMASGRNGTLYTGVTSKLGLRVEQHKLGAFGGSPNGTDARFAGWAAVVDAAAVVAAFRSSLLGPFDQSALPIDLTESASRLVQDDGI